MKVLVLMEDVLREMGRSGIGLGGFMVDADGHLIEEYVEDEEEKAEGLEADGDEPEDCEDFRRTDCIRGAAECVSA